MFQFTREFIINDNGTGVAGAKGLLSDGKRFEVSNDTLMVARMVNIRKQDVVSIHKHAYAAEAEEVVKLTVPTVAANAGEIYRLVITIRQEGKVSALVNDQYPWHSKQYFYEGLADATTGAAPLATWVAEATKEANIEGVDRLIDVTTAGGKLVISARDCYTRIHEVRVVKVPGDDRTAAQALTGYQDYELVALWNKAIQAKTSVVAPEVKAASGDYTIGSEGAGTVARILKNMRLLTDAHLDPYGLQRDERPLPTGKYTQYTVECATERRHIGAQVFGAIDHSLATHVFFVESGVASAFETELAKIGTICAAATEAGVAHEVTEKAGAAAAVQAKVKSSVRGDGTVDPTKL